MGQKLGQHFLVNKGIIEKIIAAASLEKSDAVLEIGPGTGALTFALAPHVKKVIAVEKDTRLAEKLRAELARRNITNVEVIADDILRFFPRFMFHVPCSMSHVPSSKFQVSCLKVISNIPYYLTSALIRALLENPRKPAVILLMIQKEVANRICAADGNESILSLSVKYYADPRILFSVSSGSFAPPPKVDSAVIKIIPKDGAMPIDPVAFFRVVKAGFSAPRKKLAGNLARKLALPRKNIEIALAQSGINIDARPEKVLLAQWIMLTKYI